METFEKAKQALKKYLLENKEEVIKDLDEMRRKSTGNDIFRYLEATIDGLQETDKKQQVKYVLVEEKCAEDFSIEVSKLVNEGYVNFGDYQKHIYKSNQVSNGVVEQITEYTILMGRYPQ